MLISFVIDKFSEFRNVGVNRLSIGVQSFDDNQLKFLGRIHSAKEAKNAVIKAQKVGFAIRHRSRVLHAGPDGGTQSYRCQGEPGHVR